MSYLSETFDQKYLKDTIELAKKSLNKIKKETNFEVVVFTGHSGALLAYPLLAITDIPIVLVRKKFEKTHGSTIEKIKDFKKYLIIDDFIDSGQTVKNIISIINIECVDKECVGIYLYRSDAFYNKASLREDICYPIYDKDGKIIKKSEKISLTKEIIKEKYEPLYFPFKLFYNGDKI